MSCYYHKDKEANMTCSNCGKLICTDCGIEIEGRMYCKNCIVDIVKAKKYINNDRPITRSNFSQSSKSDYNRGNYTQPPHDVNHRHSHKETDLNIKYYNAFITFCCSMLPGAGYMFLGLIKRGLFFLMTFFLSIYILAVFDSPIGGFMMVIIFMVSFFDTFRIRGLLNRGAKIDDNFDDAVEFLKKYYIAIIVIFAFDILRNILSSVFSWGYYGMNYFNSFFAIAIMLFGIYIVYNATKKKKQEEELKENNSEFVDKR